ncbi:MAG: hypothetical protein LUE86_09575, partial [Clostridiales bacterium]|nr:hypothetical protein [Clostridiales bacterium]
MRKPPDYGIINSENPDELVAEGDGFEDDPDAYRETAYDIIQVSTIYGVIIMMDYAILSSKGQYTIFCYGQDTFRFRAPYSLEYYSEIKEWDHGYIAVMAKYQYDEELIEEYIDLVPILENLYV